MGCIAGMDVDRRVLLVINAEDSYLIADLVVNHGPGGDERPKVGRDRQRCPAGQAIDPKHPGSPALSLVSKSRRNSFSPQVRRSAQETRAV